MATVFLHYLKFFVILALTMVVLSCGGSDSNEPSLPEVFEMPPDSRSVGSISEVSGNWKLERNLFPTDETFLGVSSSTSFVMQINEEGVVTLYYPFGSGIDGTCYIENRNSATITRADDASLKWQSGNGTVEPLALNFVDSKLVLSFGSRTEIYVTENVLQEQLDQSCFGPLDPGFTLVEEVSEIAGVWQEGTSFGLGFFFLVDQDGGTISLRYDTNARFNDSPCYRESDEYRGQLDAIGEGQFFIVGSSLDEPYRFSINTDEGALTVERVSFAQSWLVSDRTADEFDVRCRTEVEFVRQTAQPVETNEEIEGVWEVLAGVNNEDEEEIFYVFDNNGEFTEIDFQGDIEDGGEMCYKKTTSSSFQALGAGRFLQIYNGGTTDEVEVYVSDSNLKILRPGIVDLIVETVVPSSRLATDFAPTCPS